MCNHPPPKRWNRFLPLHASVMVILLNFLEDKYHHGSFDNIYNSAIFFQAECNHPKNALVLVHGITRKGGRGIPSCMQQDEVKTRTSVQKVWGNVKVAKLEDNLDFPCLVASSVYMIEWIVNENPVFNVKTNKIETMSFLHLNQINKYNYDMGNVDITYQL